MKKTFVMVILTLFLSAIVGNVFSEEIAKEGSGTGMSIASGKYKIHQIEEGTGFVSWKQKGVSVRDSGEGPFHNMSQNCIGVQLWEKGVGSGIGYCVGITPDGDKILYQITQENVKPGPGLKKGKYKFIDGTGKFAGIEGGGEYTQYSVQPAEEGTYQNVGKTKGSYKLP
jgi:hypothetical protein